MNVGSVSNVVTGADADKSATVLVARKALDFMKQQGDATIRLLESAKLEPHKGNNINVFS
jgi:hypothetical protein